MTPKLVDDLNTLARLGMISKEIPEHVTANLNPKMPLRPYQEEALRRFLFYVDGYPQRRQRPHLLWHMATGSGKTLIMAGLILELYARGYRQFVFFVNSRNIIEKTRLNFTDAGSSKHLFAETIHFGDRQVRIVEVENLQAGYEDDIQIIFTTIQGLHEHLNTPRENSVTYEDFAAQRVALISDEAHHLNVLTKKALNQGELTEMNTWEATVTRIFQARPDNLLLEFTATVDLDDPEIAAKYADKILFEYDLKHFRLDGYSKEVEVLQADLPPLERMLQAAVVSQYRRIVAEKHGLQLKPVVLMKSRTIKESREHEVAFREAIDGLDGARLATLTPKQGVVTQMALRREGETNPMARAFSYLAAEGLTLDELANEIREEFGPERCVSVNSKDDSETKQLLVNSLEDRDNPIRVVFAVDKLNEGWDVLNLFDIVRLYDTRDAKAGKPGKTTMSEAQLIGRGARYCPFAWQGEAGQSLARDQRKFDQDAANALRALETLYYHSAHNPRYIAELRTALETTGIVPPRTLQLELRVKQSFRDSAFWRQGMLFVNERRPNPREEATSLAAVGLQMRYDHRLATGYAGTTTILAEGEMAPAQLATVTTGIRLLDLGVNVVRSAMQRLPFYRFGNLKAHFPRLTSTETFLTSKDYLADVHVDVIGGQGQVATLTQREKRDVAVAVLTRIAEGVQRQSPSFIGTRKFKPMAIRAVVKDKMLHVAVDDSGEAQLGVAMSHTPDTALRLDLRHEDWYAFEENYGTREEKSLVRYVHGMMPRLRERYEDVYLIRNEKMFQLYRFSDGRALEPDFAMYAVEKGSRRPIIYQMFVEPKGQHLIQEDLWKQAFLLEIAEEYELEPLFEGMTYRIAGLPFYNERETKTKFAEALERQLGV